MWWTICVNSEWKNNCKCFTTERIKFDVVVKSQTNKYHQQTTVQVSTSIMINLFILIVSFFLMWKFVSHNSITNIFVYEFCVLKSFLFVNSVQRRKLFGKMFEATFIKLPSLLEYIHCVLCKDLSTAISIVRVSMQITQNSTIIMVVIDLIHHYFKQIIICYFSSSIPINVSFCVVKLIGTWLLICPSVGLSLNSTKSPAT